MVMHWCNVILNQVELDASNPQIASKPVHTVMIMIVVMPSCVLLVSGPITA